MKHIHPNLAIPFEVYLLNSGCKSNHVKHQGIVQYWRKGTKMMEINNLGVMNKPMQEAYKRFLHLYLKHGRKFIESLRRQVVVA